MYIVHSYIVTFVIVANTCVHCADNTASVGYVVSANEGIALKMAHTHSDEFAQLTRHTLTRVYPNSVRVDSSNMNPQEFWNFGIQCVALNYQTPGLMMDLQVLIT